MNKNRHMPGFGELNPVEEPNIARVLDTKNTSATDIIKQAALDIFKKDSFENSGPLKGIVLRIESNPDSHEPDSWISRVFGNEKPPTLKTLKVRIPELHAALPEPTQYGQNAGSSNKIIDLYPSFIAISGEISGKSVAVGDIVSVDFVNRVNMSQPIYLGPIIPGAFPGAVGEKKTKTLFDEKPKLNIQSPPGDHKEKNSQNQISTAIDKQPEKEQQFIGIPTKSKARLIPMKMDKARFGFAAGAGYPNVRIREDIAEELFEIKRILNELGCVLVSVGSIRPLNAPVSTGRVATSFHYAALAIDLWTHAGCYPDGNPNTDEYVVQFDHKNLSSNGPKFIVWAKSTENIGKSIQTNAGTFQVENKEIPALDVRKTSNKSPPEIISIKGNFVNLTKIFLAHDFFNIGGHKQFYIKSVPMTSEHWHFESRKGLVANQTTFKNVLDVIYTDNGEPPYKFGSYVWNGNYFKKS